MSSIKKEIFSSGGGVQSSAIAALIIQGKLPKPDLIVIADTGRECPETWNYLKTVIQPALSTIGIEIHRIDHSWSTIPSHGKDYLNHKGNTFLCGVWSNQTGNLIKLPGFCSSQWKVQAIDRYLSKTHGITRSKYRKWIGFSLDEWQRTQRIMVSRDGAKGLIRLPLVQDIPLNRWQAIEEVKKIGWPPPPRSRCWMCPNQPFDQWKDLKLNHPEAFQKAVDFEREMKLFDPSLFLNKSCVKLPEINFSLVPPQLSLFDPNIYCTSGVCFI